MPGTRRLASALTSAPWLLIPGRACVGARREQVAKADVSKQLGPHSVRHAVHDLRSILGGIDVYAERTLAKR